MKKILYLMILWFLFTPDLLKAEQSLNRRLMLTGTIEGDIYYTENESRLFISRLELGAEATFTEWLKGFVLLKAEDIGTAEETAPFIDEVTLTFKKDDFPFYLILGKRAQPFGVFENHLITDPLTQDAYETVRAGLTIGYEGPLGSDLSLTVYHGDEQMNHLFEAGIFDTERVARKEGGIPEFSSLILSATLSPVQNDYTILTFFGSFLTEEGRSSRNNTLSTGASLMFPSFKNIRIDAEFMKALSRETYNAAPKAFKEAVYSVSVAYDFILRKKKIIGSDPFTERKAHLMAEPFKVALRYEYFDDDGMHKELGVWTLKERFSAGFRYTFYKADDFSAYLAGEFRRTNYRAKEDDSEAFFRLGVSF